jgi:hypothetical protein
MRTHHQNTFNAISTLQNVQKSDMVLQLQTQMQQATSPKHLKDVVTDIIGDIMKNIRKQILSKMRQLDVIVKEPLYRRMSHDDYNLCFENFNKKTGFSESLSQANAFGYTLNGTQTPFTNVAAVPRRRYEEDQSSSSSMASQKS